MCGVCHLKILTDIDPSPGKPQLTPNHPLAGAYIFLPWEAFPGSEASAKCLLHPPKVLCPWPTAAGDPVIHSWFSLAIPEAEDTMPCLLIHLSIWLDCMQGPGICILNLSPEQYRFGGWSQGLALTR